MHEEYEGFFNTIWHELKQFKNNLQCKSARSVWTKYGYRDSYSEDEEQIRTDRLFNALEDL